MTDAMYRRTLELMEADLGNELVALDPDAGNCFGFNEVATTVWRSLSQPKSFTQLRDELMNQYDVGQEQCTSELHSLLEDMVAKRLIEKNDC